MAHQREALTFASAGSYTSSLNIGGAAKVAIELPSFDSNFAAAQPIIYPQVKRRSGDTFYDLYEGGGSTMYPVMASATSGNFIINIPAEGNELI